MLEIGSEFHAVLEAGGPRHVWPKPHSWFALGRAALHSVCRLHWDGRLPGSLWVPDFFCGEVLGYLHSNGWRLRTFRDDPRNPEPHWTSLEPSRGDIVLAVNYFGVRSGESWAQWKADTRDVLLVEDHSHDIFSTWSIQSRADYAFASVRKTAPVSDGAILWSPMGRQLPPEPAARDWSGAALKFAAMVLKAEYLLAGTTDSHLKHVFRHLAEEGERRYSGAPETRISPVSRDLLEGGFPVSWRARREENTRMFLREIEALGAFRNVFDSWPAGHCPFNPVLELSSAGERNDLRRYLINCGVYPPVHWPDSPWSSESGRRLAERVLTIPLDQRYGEADVSAVLRCVSGFLARAEVTPAGAVTGSCNAKGD